MTDEHGDSSFMTRSQNLRMAQNMSDFDCSLHIIAPPKAYEGQRCDDMMDMDAMDDGAEDDENDNGGSSTILHNSRHNNLEKPHYSVVSNAEHLRADRSVVTSALTATNNELVLAGTETLKMSPERAQEAL